jgi:hypothetical protein
MKHFFGWRLVFWWFLQAKFSAEVSSARMLFKDRSKDLLPRFAPIKAKWLQLPAKSSEYFQIGSVNTDV